MPRPLVLERGVEPQPGRLDGEVAAVLADPALADVEDLLALEQRVHDGRPLLVGGCTGGGAHVAQDNGGPEEEPQWRNDSRSTGSRWPCTTRGR